MSMMIGQGAKAIDQSLVALAEKANGEHALALHAAGTLLEHAFLAGDALQSARALLPPGAWQDWVAREFHGSLKTANWYRRMALHKDLLIARGVTTQKEAHTHLRELSLGLELGAPVGQRGAPLDRRREARALVLAGHSQAEVAELYGVCKATIWGWVHPDREKRQNRKDQRKRKAAAAALRRQARDEAARKTGGNLAAAYSRMRLLAQDLESAAVVETNRDAKAAISSALHILYRLEDQINKAIGTTGL